MLMNEKLKNARKYLGLSQEFVSRQMRLSRLTINAIESGQRKVTTDELDRFSKLYGMSIDELMGEQLGTEMFIRGFSKLSDNDRKEIINLIDFKRRYTGSRIS